MATDDAGYAASVAARAGRGFLDREGSREAWLGELSTGSRPEDGGRRQRVPIPRDARQSSGPSR
mgnify:CR=1 FL=1